MSNPTVLPNSVAALIAKYLKSQGVSRVFALCGGHIMPIWMSLDALGIHIVDVRDERAAVYMAHAHSELTGDFFSFDWKGSALKKEFKKEDKFIPITHKKDWEIIRKIDAANGVKYACK